MQISNLDGSKSDVPALEAKIVTALFDAGQAIAKADEEKQWGAKCLRAH
jgi:hypothetical protein